MENEKIEIPIMFCFDNNYVIPAAVSFYSLLEHADKRYYYHMFVLHSDITIENQNKLKETINEFNSFSELEFVDLQNRFDDIWEPIRIKGHFSKEVMYKVLVASIFPQYEKIIVSDVDVVFLDDISESFNCLDINENVYLAGTKFVGKMASYMENYKPDFSDDEIEKLKGFCGGFIVFNLRKLRDDNMEKKFIDCFINEGYRINQMEQDVLNLCCYPKTKKLPLRYLACSYMWDIYLSEEDMLTDSHYTKEEIKNAMEHPVQLHYATSTKPWKDVSCTKSEEWFRYIVKTPFLSDYLKYLSQNILTINNTPEISIEQNYRILNWIKYIIENPLFIFKISFYKKLISKIIGKLIHYKTKIIKHINYLDDFSLLIIDDIFPNELSPFRYEEYIEYFKNFKNVFSLSTGKSLKYLDESLSLDKVISDFEYNYPNYREQILNLDKGNYTNTINSLGRKICIITFLNNLFNHPYYNLKFLESNHIPFVFTLYPGGGFVLDDEESNMKLKKVFASKCFKKVIVTQKLTMDYLLNNKYCNKNDIKFIYGIVTPKIILDGKQLKKEYFGYNKDIFDICFIAHKYFSKGKDKGYDLFISVAKLLAKRYNNIKFHVVGGFDDKDINIDEIKDSISFYGIQSSSWLKKFYKNMDAIVSPNRPFIINKGSFDGFPTGSCTEAMLNGVALFCSDELNLNIKYKNNKEIVLIKPDVQDILTKIEYYYRNPKLLRKLSIKGKKVTYKNYSYKKQIKPRLKLIKNVMKEIYKNEQFL